MTPKLLLAIDVGTSGCKVAAISTDGTVISESSRAWHVSYPHIHWAEQDPNEWWEQICVAIRACLDHHLVDPGQVAGIGVAGQSWSCIPVDRDGEVLAPTPIWTDSRAAEICERTVADIGAEEILRHSGNSFKPNYTTPKILWFREQRPEVFGRTRWFLQSNSFIVMRLTGLASQDFSQGYGLHMFDMDALRYDADMCAAFGIDQEVLPPLIACHGVVGSVTSAAASVTGLHTGTPVVAGGLDAACGTLGVGVTEPGQAQEQAGQAGGMSICLDSAVREQSLILSPHVIPGRWLLQGGTVGGGASMRWLTAELGGLELEAQAGGGENAMVALDRLAATVPPASDGVIFLPYLAGERSPIWDAKASGVFFGLRFDTKRAHFFRAVLEGTAYALEHNLRVAAAAGAPIDLMVSSGGGARSELWTQIKADVTGKRIAVPAQAEATLLGAALLAGVGVGVYPDFAGAVDATVAIAREVQPDAQRHALYGRYFEIYLQLYQQLQATMAQQARLLSEDAEALGERKGIRP